ncbi:MAG: hypothetical protein IKW85_04585 [Muribaculaceae bacterium]|nr:hypothetical protein [Muribaculaceae bacterium]
MISPRDTIAANDSVLEAFRNSGDYDYARELVPNHEVNYFDRLWRSLDDFVDMGNPADEIPNWLWWAMGALLLMALCYLIWRYRTSLFGPRVVDIKEEEITEDDINEVDFDQLIAEAVKNGDHLMLCRLRYLQTLKAASDASLVAWRRYKTPMQYAMEWQDDDFNVMTNHFLRIRYGHYTADAALAEEMRSRQEAALARIAGSNGKQEPANHEEEGGVQS